MRAPSNGASCGCQPMRLPHQPDRLLHAAAENLALRLRHRRRQRQNDGAQTARRGGVRHAAALCDAVDLHQRLRQQLAQHQAHHRAAAVMGGEYRQPLGRRQGGQRHALVVDQGGQRRGGGHRLVPFVEAPAGRIALLVPQIAPWAGDAGGAFMPFASLRQLRGFTADAGDGRPLEGVVASTLEGQMRLAERDPRKLHPALEQFVVDAVRFGQRAQLQLIGLLQAVALFRMVLDQHAAGVRIADVQHQIDVDRRLLQRRRRHFYLRYRQLMAEHVQQVEVVRLILEGFQPGVDLCLGALFPLGGALAERLAQPAVHPG